MEGLNKHFIVIKTWNYVCHRQLRRKGDVHVVEILCLVALCLFQYLRQVHVCITVSLCTSVYGFMVYLGMNPSIEAVKVILLPGEAERNQATIKSVWYSWPATQLLVSKCTNSHKRQINKHFSTHWPLRPDCSISSTQLFVAVTLWWFWLYQASLWLLRLAGRGGKLFWG